MPELSLNALWILIVFIIGYACITLEHWTKFNKAAVALLMAAIMWILLFLAPVCKEDGTNVSCFLEHLSGISQIIFFLMGALTIVELININHGFQLISNYINVTSKRRLLWVMGILTFFLSSILDNLTTTIVMVTLLRKLLNKDEDRLLIGGGIVIAANAGGAWTPIGDVTTTMLWIGGQVTSYAIIRDLFFPSVICVVVALTMLSFFLKGDCCKVPQKDEKPVDANGKTVFTLGILALVFVPVFKVLTGLPPVMGILFGLSVLWLVTDWFHWRTGNLHRQVPDAFSKIDLSSTFFFLGILLSVDVLDLANLLDRLAIWLDTTIDNVPLIATLIGLFSAVVDNVPLVAASMSMYGILQHPVDSQFWELVAFCAGTGGSILIIGSAAGVVYMGLEKVDFFWYIKRISLPALLGYAAGILTYLYLEG
ncbi:MAG: sodium:proton antiporter NhaD [Parachlamydiaceae bacterium]|nr:sodium:proton antiporter NhaD [Parachlamydiaceae bacterium]